MDIQMVLVEMRNNGRAVSSIKRALGQIRECLESAKNNGMIQGNPAFDIKVAWTNKSKEEHVLTSEEEETFLNAVKGNWYNEMFHTMFLTGMRVGEIGGLKWEDVDFEEKTLRVARFERHQQKYTTDFAELTQLNHVIIDFDTKGDYGERLVDLTDDAIYILQMLKDFYESEHLESEWLFVNKNGRIHNRAMDLRIRRYCRLAGINEKSLHKVRSTFISMLRDAGMSFEKIAEEVGHKSIITTMNHYSYDTLDAEQNRTILNKGLKILAF